MPVLLITNTGVSDSQKKICLGVGRMHPGESNGSIVLLGLIRYLVSPEAE